MKKHSLSSFFFLSATILAAPLLALAQPNPAPNTTPAPPDAAQFRLKEWRLDDVKSLRDNGLRGEVVLNGVWMREFDGKTTRQFIPGGATLKDQTQTYWREVRLPKGWENRRLMLELGGVSGAKAARLDGKPIANFKGKAFIEYPIAPAKTADGFHRLEVVASGRIEDDVWLRSYPQSAARIDETFITTSFREKNARLQLSGAAPKNERVRLQIAISETPDGPPVLRFGGAAASENGVWQAQTGAKWPNPKLWSRTFPNLYFYRTELLDEKGVVRDRILPRRFGFREVWIENGDILINGIRNVGLNDAWHWRLGAGGNANAQATEMLLRRVKADGFSYTALQPVDVLANLTDEIGIMTYVVVGSLVRFNIWNPRNGLTAMTGNERVDDITRVVKRFREHPSVAFWVSHAAYSQASMNAELVGRPFETWKYFPLNRNSAGSKEAQELFRYTQNLVQKLDPTRTVNCHNGPFTRVDLTTRYLTNDLDLQEREEFHDDWFRSLPENKQAIIAGEWGTPFSAEFLLRRIDFQLPQTRGVLPKIHLEMGARYLGEAAYLDEPEAEIRTWTQTDGYRFRRSPTFQKQQSEATEWTMRAWRTHGVSGASHYILLEDGYAPLDRTKTAAVRYGFSVSPDPRVPGFAPNTTANWPSPEMDEIYPLGRAYLRSITPIYAFIGGPDTRFTSKDHLFFAGSSVRKAAIVINDRDDAVEIDGQWQLKNSAGTVVSSGEIRGKVGGGERALTQFPIEFAAPEVTQRTDFTLALQLRGDKPGVYEDSFAITVFPRHNSAPKTFGGDVWTLNISDDRTHETPHFYINQENDALLKAAGLDAKLVAGLKTFTFTDNSLGGAAELDSGRKLVTDGTPKPGDVLIIPRFTLRHESDDYQLNLRLLQKMGLDKLVESGVNVVIFEQNLPNIFGMNTEERRPRRAFIAAKGHPVFEGLSDSDLSYWAGSSSLAPASESLSPSHQQFPERLWHVSNTNSVATKTLIRPQVGAARALAVSGFDLQESPLLEVARGKGRILFCQFDVSDRYGKCPAATQLVDNLLRYAMNAPAPNPAKNQIRVASGAQVTPQLNLLRAPKPAGEMGWGITAGELFFRESVYKGTFGTKPDLTVPTFADGHVVRRAADGTPETTLSPSLLETGWGQRKIAWLHSALVINNGGSRLDGPALSHQGNKTDLYPIEWVNGFVHPYNANIW